MLFRSQLLLANKTLPYPSFMKLSEFLISKDPDIWSSSRDIILKPLLNKARPEAFVNLAVQLNEVINMMYERIKRDSNYTWAIESLTNKRELINFEFMRLLNICFGEVELRAISVLCYMFSVHGDLVATEDVIKRCVELICFLIGYFFNE